MRSRRKTEPRHLRLRTTLRLLRAADPANPTDDVVNDVVDNSVSESEQSTLQRVRIVAYTGSPMYVEGWEQPVVVDLDGLTIPSQSRPIRVGHDPDRLVGHTTAITVDGRQLVAEGVLSVPGPDVDRIVEGAKNGYPWQASIGVRVDQSETIPDGQPVSVNGREVVGPVVIVRQSTLGEISVVDLGADEGTSSQVAAPVPHSNDPTVGAVRAAALAETRRITAIRRICAGRHVEIEARAIASGWDATRTELEVLRATRPRVSGFGFGPGRVNNEILEAACMLTARADGVERLYSEQTLEAASRRYRRGIGLQELLLEAAWANGYTGRTARDHRAVLEAAFSTSDIGGILSNVANKFLLDGFFAVERTWRNICSVRNVNDFKTITSYRLVGKDQYELVPPGGEIKHGTLDNEVYTNRADTYGLMLSIDRRDVINDDLGAITTVPAKLGRGAGLKINDVFWSIFLNNAAFFSVGNANYISGANTALSVDSLTQAEVAFLDQTDGNGQPIGVMPAILLVPTALAAIGSQLFKALELRDNSSAAKYPITNPHQGKYRVEVSRYLSNAKYTGYSAKAWYLLAEPTDLPVIEVAFLGGQEAPTIETAEADFSLLGVRMRGYHDFGVALQDPKGGVKAKGEA